jgi:transcription antitermination factor NusG
VLDATVERVVARDGQDAAHAYDLAPTPSGRRATGPRWYVLATYAQGEKRAHAALHLKGFEVYLPLLTVRKPNRHYHTGALFPGYLFCHLDLSRPWHAVRYAPGVFSLLEIEGMPTPCPCGVVEALRAGEEARRTPTASETPHRPGDACGVAHGALAGHRGAILRVTSQRAVVALVIFGGLREVTLPLDSLAPAT